MTNDFITAMMNAALMQSKAILDEGIVIARQTDDETRLENAKKELEEVSNEDIR